MKPQTALQCVLISHISEYSTIHTVLCFVEVLLM